jgi:hypothetical protein
MSIVRPTPPSDLTAAFSVELPKFVAAPPDSIERYVGSRPEIPTMADLGVSTAELLHDAHQIFVLGLADAASATSLSAASSSGWRVFAGTAEGPVLMAKVASRQSMGWKMTAAYYGDRVRAALRAALELDELPQVSSGDYELRVLTVPALNLDAFWLANQGTAGYDLIVPFPAAPNQLIAALNTQPVYTMPDFLAAIRPLAQLKGHALPLHGS